MAPKKRLATRLCPFCHYALPDNIERAKSYHITLAGQPGSGKTLFLAAAIQELRSSALAEAFGIRVWLEDREVEDLFQAKYYDHFRGFAAGTVLSPQKQPADKYYDPLVIIVGRRGQRDVNMIFYDIAGEDITGPDNASAYARYLLQADALIMVQDPLTIDGIVQQVVAAQQPLKVPSERSQGEADLGVVAQFYMRAHRQDTIPIPTAITLTKSDLLRQPHQQAQYRFFGAPEYRGGMLKSEFDAVDAEVQILLSDLPNKAGQGLLSWKSRFKNAHFFAVSAIGGARADGTFAEPMRPIRVLDPILWILGELGIVQLSHPDSRKE